MIIYIIPVILIILVTSLYLMKFENFASPMSAASAAITAQLQSQSRYRYFKFTYTNIPLPTTAPTPKATRFPAPSVRLSPFSASSACESIALRDFFLNKLIAVVQLKSNRKV